MTARALDRFRSSFDGEVVVPGDPDYDGARRVWSALFDRHPALVARPKTVAGVAAAIRFARESDVPLAVRAGGHSVTGFSTCDGGLVIDLSSMRGVTVDPEARLARASGGALLAELDRAAQPRGLVCPVGVVGHTGVAGLALGGGVGRLQRRFGLTLDNLAAVELVTADGRLVRATERDEPDLFSAMRGAGPNFGVVTALEFRLHAFGPNLARGFRVYRPGEALVMWQAFRDIARTAPRELGLSFVVGRAVPEADYPAEIAGGPIVVVAFSYAGTEAAALAAVAPLGRAADPVMETSGEKSYLEIQGTYDEAYGWGQRYYTCGGFADDLQLSTIAALVDHAVTAPGDGSFTASLQGGAIRDVPDEATAYAGRRAAFRTLAEAGWQDPGEDAAAFDWCRRAMAIAGPEGLVGRYVNEVFEDGTDPATIYGPDILRHLVRVKQAWDPDNVFRMNHNIRP
ncbi:MAG TPA: FAD-binding oxidoreductase [Candidatus Limnocylindrales bacterium]|nr:FAD-binding oxidoreductase [Candidatus Limnocylindrales bacterium]